MVHAHDLVKTSGDVRAVGGVTFQVARGEIFAFLGPNGAGKTTTIQMLTTLLRPTSGAMSPDGVDPIVRPLDARRTFGIVFQDPSLDNELTAYENMNLHGVLYHVPRRQRVDRIEKLLTLFELWDRRNALVKTFSGGMKRRLEIARGLLHTPKIPMIGDPVGDLLRFVRRDPRRAHRTVAVRLRAGRGGADRGRLGVSAVGRVVVFEDSGVIGQREEQCGRRSRAAGSHV